MISGPERHDLLSWMTSTDHKRIGILYMGTSLFFLLIAGILGMLIRTQLARPDSGVLAPQTYNAIFTLHGTAMIFLVIAPFGFGLANYLIPLQIGAPDMAFPRLNATSFWVFLFGGLTVFAMRHSSVMRAWNWINFSRPRRKKSPALPRHMAHCGTSSERLPQRRRTSKR